MSAETTATAAVAAPAALTRVAAPADPDREFALWLGERLRRVALGGTAALLAARAYWPGEPDLRAEGGGGLVWVLALLAVAGVAIAATLVGGTLRARWSAADGAAVSLFALAAFSAGHAAEYRTALNLAFEWVGYGVAYLLVRNLPRTRAESDALAAALVATAVAVAAYGLYQVKVELPEIRQAYNANKAEALRVVGITPGSPQEALYANRVLGSNEPYATFALANSLAGFLLGPLVLMLAAGWRAATRAEPGGGGLAARLAALGLAAVPCLAVLGCLTLTKSRSAYVGLAVAVAVLAWGERRRVRARTLAVVAAGAVLVVGGLTAAGLAAGRLDRQVLSESGKSLRYRREYWVGAWRVITQTPGVFWRGLGPGNFQAPYVLHKLPEASEEVADPHNIVLEVWSTAGLWAVLALAGATGLGLWSILGPSRTGDMPPESSEERPPPPYSPRDPAAPPRSAAWLVACGGGGWLAVWALGKLDPIMGDLDRWAILGLSWALAAGCGLAVWRWGAGPGAWACGAAAIGVLVNLLAAGGVSVAGVALALWVVIALGQNLREDRPCGRLRVVGGRAAGFALASAWVAVVGTYYGSVVPFWRAEAAMARGERMAVAAVAGRPADFDRAERAYEDACALDKYGVRPWVALAAVQYRTWEARGRKPDDLRWKKPAVSLSMASREPRSERSWSRHRERAVMLNLILKQIGDRLKPLERVAALGGVVEATRRASRLYPTNADLHARLAEASAEIGFPPDALIEAREALRLDKLTPHEDKKLTPAVRQWLLGKVSAWEAAAASPTPAPPSTPPAPGPARTTDKPAPAGLPAGQPR